ncbi:2-dehydropantoate 2-reductase N-terminal domain-containing protein [Clostridium sp. AWRP]|uniref:ketopantoate reductase family protein n=1 Tax=Clostridium sp. AWRP TaxID=2212991 RepID=UPI000FDCB107|nr:2-dehydropantoate 2-reductase N-terminal domain-containing protein [Clostridium sp. AWRP]AZV56396.1 ketopantoate reductase family protein [Clostridium sp. AWRP]
MKILVYGAGVLGSYLAYELVKGGHNVTILARGKRYNELKEKGLVIKHYLQLKTTITKLNVVDKFNQDDYYDTVFVVMQRTQIDSMLPNIYCNKKCKLYVFVSNNPSADATYKKIQENSIIKPKMLFAFQKTGGRRELGKVISIHIGKTSFSIGDISGDISYKTFINKIFVNTSFKLYHSPNIDAWLKFHIALVVPIAYLTYFADGDLKKIARNKKMLNLTIDAISEGCKVVKTCGYEIEPKDLKDYLNRKRRLLYWIFKIMAATPLGKLAASDHAMSAVDEMKYLSNEFDKLKKSSGILTPNWDKLEKYI